MESEKSNKELQESIECAMIRANSLESSNNKLLKENKLFSKTIKTLTATTNSKGGMGKVNSDVEKRCRLLGQRVAELEAQSNETSSALEQKLKKANEALSNKSKDLKNKESSLKTAERNVRNLNDKLNESKK